MTSKARLTNNKKNNHGLFEQAVWRAIVLIPVGKVSTYKDVANAIKRPRATRAVGNALNKNPDLLKVPCHRVVRSNGTVGGYRKGSGKKINLLKGEGIRIEKGKIKDFASYKYCFK